MKKEDCSGPAELQEEENNEFEEGVVSKEVIKPEKRLTGVILTICTLIIHS